MPGPFFRIGTPSKQQPKTVKDIFWGRDLGILCWRRISPGRRRDIIEVARGERGHGGRCTPSVKETSHDRESTRQGPCKISHLFASRPLSTLDQGRRMSPSGDSPSSVVKVSITVGETLCSKVTVAWPSPSRP